MVIGDGFTLDCDVADAGTSDTVSAEVTIRNVRRYKSSIDVAHWLYFDILAGVDYTTWSLPIKLHYADGTYMECSERVSDMTAGQFESGLVIPDICGSDVEWYAAEFSAPGYFECSGCGVYYLGDLPVGRAIPPGASANGLEIDRVMDDYRLQSQSAR